MNSIAGVKEEPLPRKERWQIVDAYATENTTTWGEGETASYVTTGTTHITVKYLGENKALNVLASANSSSYVNPENSGVFYYKYLMEQGDLSKGETFNLELFGYTMWVHISWDIQGYHESYPDNQLETTIHLEDLQVR